MKLIPHKFFSLIVGVCFCANSHAAIEVFTANNVQYALTQATYAYNSDWSSNVSTDLVGQEVSSSSELISSATVADWTDLKTNFAGDTAGFISLLGGQYGDSGFLLFNGAQNISGYGYFAEVHLGTTPGGWAVIDTIDSGQIDLGRWTGNRYIVAEVLTDSTPVPEPTMFPVVFGLAALFTVACRRRD